MKLDHVQLAMPVGNEAKAKAFFSDLLGMQELEKPEPLASRGGCWFALGKAHLHLGVETPFIPQRKAHPAFVIDELDTLASLLAAADYPVIWDEAIPDRRRFYTNDPFGNRIEFIQAGDGFTEK